MPAPPPKPTQPTNPPPSDPCVDFRTAHFFPDEGTTDPQEGTTLGTSPEASPLRQAIPQPTPALPLPKRNIHPYNSNRPPNSREWTKKKRTCLRTKITYIQKAREAASPKATRNGARTHLTPSLDPPATLSPGQLPSGPTPPLRPPPTLAMPPPCQLPPPTTTLGPPHCITDAPPATSPITPSPAATPEAEPWTPASTCPELTQTPWRHRPRGPDAPTPSLNPENEPSVMNRGTGDNSQRIPVRSEAASLANQSSLHLAASSSAHNASPSGTHPRPSICVRCSRKPRTSNACSIATHTDVFLSCSIASFSVRATSWSSLARQSSPSRTANDVVKASTCLQRKTSMIEGIGAGGLDNRSKGTPGVGEKKRDSRGPADGSRPRSFLLGPTPKGREAQRFPRITTKDTPFPRPPRKSPAFPAGCPMLPSFSNVGQNLVRFGTPRKSTTTTTDDSTKTPSVIPRRQVSTTYNSSP
ncbi:hypothetical protein E4T56_gene8066 [Termitomyces sp. T112]|nr:hypothetical protein E4T56_gene8066 [Termitomyces sp. T112]